MRLAVAALCATLLFPVAAVAADILSAFYDRATDALVVDIAYRGTQPGHPFSVHWGECRPHTVGRLVDEQGADAAREDFRVRQRFGIASLDCRPAKVTLRLGPVSHATVSVPARP